MKRIPLIKFPLRHPKPSGTPPKIATICVNEDVVHIVFSRAQSSSSVSGMASEQPKRTPVTQDEIDALLLGGCF